MCTLKRNTNSKENLDLGIEASVQFWVSKDDPMKILRGQEVRFHRSVLADLPLHYAVMVRISRSCFRLFNIGAITPIFLWNAYRHILCLNILRLAIDITLLSDDCDENILAMPLVRIFNSRVFERLEWPSIVWPSSRCM
jgi:hypothetical protein